MIKNDAQMQMKARALQGEQASKPWSGKIIISN